MAAEIVIVGGPHSGVGKTLAAELALQELRGCSYGAIKLTVADGERDPHDHGDSALLLAEAAGICGRGESCGVCETVSTKIPSRLITSAGAIHKHGTDTWRLANAGAVAVAWVIALRDAAPAALAAAIERVQAVGARGVVIEGTTALEWIRPRAAIMVATNPGKAWKRVAREQIGRCQIALWNRMPRPAGNVLPPPEFFAAAPVACDLSDPAERGTLWYRQRLRELCGVTALPSSAASAR